MIDSEIKRQYGSWTAFCLKFSYDKSNFKRKLYQNFDKLNKWLEPLDLEIKVYKKTDIQSDGILGAVICCDSFKKFIPFVNWMRTKDNICLIPYVQFEEEIIRINYCPICGEKVRNIKISESELMSFFHNT
jgi:hypothetical protein